MQCNAVHAQMPERLVLQSTEKGPINLGAVGAPGQGVKSELNFEGWAGSTGQQQLS